MSRVHAKSNRRPFKLRGSMIVKVGSIISSDTEGKAIYAEWHKGHGMFAIRIKEENSSLAHSSKSNYGETVLIDRAPCIGEVIRIKQVCNRYFLGELSYCNKKKNFFSHSKSFGK